MILKEIRYSYGSRNEHPGAVILVVMGFVSEILSKALADLPVADALREGRGRPFDGPRDHAAHDESNWRRARYGIRKDCFYVERSSGSP